MSRTGTTCRTFAENEYCTPDDPCFGCASLDHELQHPGLDEPGCEACKLRFVQLSPAATPTKTRRVAPIGNKGGNEWERAVVTDNRGMPILRADGSLIRSKDLAENRSLVETGLRRLRNSQL